MIALAAARPAYALVAVWLGGEGPGASFHYHLPDGLSVEPGHLVIVPLGNRRAQGLVVGLAAHAPVDETRPIEALADPRPVLTPEQIELAGWIADRYLTPLPRVLAAMVPLGLRSTFDQQLSLRPSAVDGAGLGRRERLVIDYLRERGSVRLRALRERLALPGASALVGRLARRGLVERRPIMVGPPRPRSAPPVAVLTSLGTQALARGEVARAPRQSEALRFLGQQPGCRADTERLRAETGLDAATLRLLVERGWVTLEAPAPGPGQPASGTRPIERLADPARPLRLSSDQEAALSRLNRA
ncbi:MAG TPA: hypothetical protein VGM69_12595, partial [Chloroflexota bacterium]